MRAVPLELGPALQTHLWEHLGTMPHYIPTMKPTAAPLYLQPCMQPGIWFHDLLPLTTIQGATVARAPPQRG